MKKIEDISEKITLYSDCTANIEYYFYQYKTSTQDYTSQYFKTKDDAKKAFNHDRLKWFDNG